MSDALSILKKYKDSGIDPEDIEISLNEACTLLGCSRAGLQLWRSNGDGPRYRRAGKYIFYNLQGILDFRRSRTVGSVGEYEERQAADKGVQS